MPFRIACRLGALALSLALPAGAETIRQRYGEDDGQTMEIHAADARGARPVVVHFGGPDPALAGLLAQRGYVLVDVALPSEGDPVAHAARALVELTNRIAAHGGDAERLHLVGDGERAPLVARLAADVDALTLRRVARESLRSVVLRDGRRLPLALGSDAPTLLLYAPDDAEARRDAERYAARLREAGASAEAMALRGEAPRGATALVAWLDTAAIARVGRFEQLAFEHEPGVPRSLSALVAHDGALYGGAADAPRLVRLDARGAKWVRERDFGAAYEAVVAIAAPDPPSRGALCVVLRGAGEMLSSACRTRHWTAPVALPIPAAGRVVALQEPRAGEDGSALFVASGARIVRIAPGGKPKLERESGAPVAALAWADGHAYAAVGGEDAAILRRDAPNGAWTRVASLAADALAAVPDPGGAGHEVLLAASAAGIRRLDPHSAHAVEVELDAREAFPAALGTGAVVRSVGAAFAPLPHPQTHDLVHALPLELSHPDRALRGAYYLVRQLDASYAYALARDFLAPRERAALARLDTIAASPFAGDAAAWFLGTDAAGRTALAHGALARSAGREGVWFDRAAPGHGLALHPVADGWLAMLYSYDAAREPVWYLAVGQLERGRFVPDSNGLSRYRLPPGASAPVRDASRSGSIEVRFDADARDAACRGADRGGAEALAVLEAVVDDRRATMCIEPIVFAPRGLPTIDATGAWQAAATDRRYGIVLAPQGYDGYTRQAALVYYYDDAGEARWALGSAPAERGASLVELSSFTGPCLGCEPRAVASVTAGSLALRMHGFCGQSGGSATLVLAYPGKAGGQLVRRNVLLERLTRARCY